MTQVFYNNTYAPEKCDPYLREYCLKTLEDDRVPSTAKQGRVCYPGSIGQKKAGGSGVRVGAK
jgi:hypothetical protein